MSHLTKEIETTYLQMCVLHYVYLDSLHGIITIATFLLQEVVFQYGTESVKNPVSEVKFYSKSDPNRTFGIKNDQVSVGMHYAWLHNSKA